MATQLQLDEALAARHQLAIGKAVASVTRDGRTVQFTATTVKDLDNYIAQLRRELAGVKPRRNRISYVVPV